MLVTEATPQLSAVTGVPSATPVAVQPELVDATTFVGQVTIGASASLTMTVNEQGAEVFVPSLRKLPLGESFIPFDVSTGHLGIDEYDVVNQLLTSHHYWITNGRAKLFYSPHRYAWPAEYDLMARIAGLTLDQRWANWHRDPFTANSTSHISVWRKPE